MRPFGDECQAQTHLGDADELLADGLGDHVPEWVAYFNGAEHAGARAVSAHDLTALGRGRRPASTHSEDPGRRVAYPYVFFQRSQCRRSPCPNPFTALKDSRDAPLFHRPRWSRWTAMISLSDANRSAGALK